MPSFDDSVRDPGGHYGIADFLALLRKRRSTIAFVLIASFAAAGVYLAYSPSRYVSRATVLIVPPAEEGTTQRGTDEYRLDGQTQIMRSDAVARRVVEALGLVGSDLSSDEAAFPRDQIRALRAWASEYIPSLGSQEEKRDPVQDAIDTMRRNLNIHRPVMSQVVEISYTSTNPARAMAVPNAYIAEYIAEMQRREESTAQANISSLEKRLDELSLQAAQAEREVETFRASNNIVGIGPNDRLLGEQHLVDLSTRLAAASADADERRLRYEQVRDSRDELARKLGGGTNSVSLVDEIANNASLTRLRQHHSLLMRRFTDVRKGDSADEGSQSVLSEELRRIEARIVDEIGRIVDASRREFELAQAHQEALERSVSKAVDENNRVNKERIKLRELELSAETVQLLYRDTLRSHATAVQQLQSGSGNPASVLSSAKMPLDKSQPQTLLVLAFAGAFGITMGIGAVLLRERLASGFDSLRQIEAILRIGAIGRLPKVHNRRSREKALPSERICAGTRRAGRVVLRAPRSRFAETIRAIRLASETKKGRRRACVIGVVSTRPREGRGTVCTNLAQLIGKTGGRVLVIDADFWEPELSRALTNDRPAGLVEVLGSKAEFNDVVWQDPASGGSFLPAGAGRDPVAEQGLVSSSRMGEFLDEVASTFDYVILRLPPIGTSIDAAAVASWTDAFILVVEWNTTPRNAVAEALNVSELLRSKIAGAVMNKFNGAKIRAEER